MLAKKKSSYSDMLSLYFTYQAFQPTCYLNKKRGFCFVIFFFCILWKILKRKPIFFEIIKRNPTFLKFLGFFDLKKKYYAVFRSEKNCFFWIFHIIFRKSSKVRQNMQKKIMRNFWDISRKHDCFVLFGPHNEPSVRQYNYFL